MSATHTRLKVAASVVLLLIAMASIQTGAALAKQLFPIVGPIGTATLRLVFAAGLLFLAFRAWRLRIARSQWRSVVLYGVALGGMNSLFYAAISRIPLGIATALEFTGPLAVALFASRRVLDVVWIALACIGLYFLLPIRSADLDLVGCLLALAAGVCWALYIIFGKKAGVEHGVRTTAIGMVIAALIVLPFGISQTGPAFVSANVLAIALLVAVLSSALPYSLEMISLRRLSTRTFGTLMSLEPAFGAVSGALILREFLDRTQVAGISAIVVASLGAVLTGSESADEDGILSEPIVGDVGTAKA